MAWKWLLLIFVSGAATYTVTSTLGQKDLLIMNSLFGIYVTIQIMGANMVVVGHGVNGRRHILSMPTLLFIIYFVLLALIVMIGFQASGAFLPETTIRIHTFALAALFGWLTAFIDWYALSYHATYYESEYHLRASLKARGCSQPFIENAVKKERERGILAPLPKKRSLYSGM